MESWKQIWMLKVTFNITKTFMSNVKRKQTLFSKEIFKIKYDIPDPDLQTTYEACKKLYREIVRK